MKKRGVELIISGAQIVLECFKEQNTKVIFGYPGGSVIPFYDALYDNLDYFKHIRTAHEQGAVHAADGYARITGNVGVCVVTSGPGATNAVTGIATAYMDSIPLVVVTGQVPRSLLGKDSFQEIDITGISVPITKYNCVVNRIEDLAPYLRKAFNIARSGRPGPVLIDIPKDIFLSQFEYTPSIIDINLKDYLHENIDEENYIRASSIISNSKRPVIYAGGGVKISNASENLCKFARKTGIPVVNTLMGLGTIDREDPLSLGLVGMHGFKEANLSVTHSDLVIAIGARFSDRVIGKSDNFASKANIIHIDIDETEIDKNISSNLSLIGDVNEILEILMEHVDNKERSSWLEEIDSYKDKSSSNNISTFHPSDILNYFNKVFNEDSIVVTDVGQHQLWTAQYWKFNSPRTFVTSGGLGTMGFGLGAAIGSKLASWDKKVLLVTGDGSFRMNCNELLTLSKYKVPLTILLMNNSSLGMVRQWQNLFSNERYSETDNTADVDYIKLGEAYGINSYRANNLENLNHILLNLNHEKTNLIECIIDKDLGVYPIVPPGKPIHDLISGRKKTID